MHDVVTMILVRGFLATVFFMGVIAFLQDFVF